MILGENFRSCVDFPKIFSEFWKFLALFVKRAKLRVEKNRKVCVGNFFDELRFVFLVRIGHLLLRIGMSCFWQIWQSRIFGFVKFFGDLIVDWLLVSCFW